MNTWKQAKFDEQVAAHWPDQQTITAHPVDLASDNGTVEDATDEEGATTTQKSLFANMLRVLMRRGL